MLYEKEISFRYKGNRDYVHGTDIFDNILEFYRNYFKVFPHRIKGSFHRPLRNNGILCIWDDLTEIDAKKSYANFSVELNGRIYQLALYRIDSQITSSIEYDESMVTENMTKDKEAVRMVVKSSFTYIEQIVALNKSLHMAIYPDVTKWLFTRIDLQDVIDPSSYPGHELAIRVKKNFHNRLTQSNVLLDNKLLGNVWFSQTS